MKISVMYLNLFKEVISNYRKKLSKKMVLNQSVNKFMIGILNEYYIYYYS